MASSPRKQHQGQERNWASIHIFVSEQSRILDSALVVSHNAIARGRTFVLEVPKGKGGEGGLKVSRQHGEAWDTNGLGRKVAQSLKGVSMEVMQEYLFHVLYCPDAIIIQI